MTKDVAVLPVAEDIYLGAVRRGGGRVVAVDEHPEGVVWLGKAPVGELHDLLGTQPQVSWVQLPFAGVDFFRESLLAYDHITFTSAKGAYNDPVAEHAVALALGVFRKFPRYARATESLGHAGRSLFGLRVAIVGAGGIGLRTIRLLRPFNTHITVVRRQPEHPVSDADRTIDLAAFRRLLPEFDLVIIAAALTPETHHLLGHAEFAALPDDAVIVNVGRGGHIDTDALVEALRNGGIGGAGIDSVDPTPLPAGHPLWSLDNVLYTPHTAATWDMIREPLAARIEGNVRAFVTDGEFVGLVDNALGY